MVSCEQNPDDLGPLEREWNAAYAGSAASGAGVQALASFASYHTDLLEKLGLSESACARFLKDRHADLKERHGDVLEA